MKDYYLRERCVWGERKKRGKKKEEVKGGEVKFLKEAVWPLRIFFFCGGKPLYMPRDLPGRSSVGESFLPLPGGGVDCSRSIWVSRVHEHISTASVLYKLARYTQFSISQSLPFPLIVYLHLQISH